MVIHIQGCRGSSRRGTFRGSSIGAATDTGLYNQIMFELAQINSLFHRCVNLSGLQHCSRVQCSDTCDSTMPQISSHDAWSRTLLRVLAGWPSVASSSSSTRGPHTTAGIKPGAVPGGTVRMIFVSAITAPRGAGIACSITTRVDTFLTVRVRATNPSFSLCAIQ